MEAHWTDKDGDTLILQGRTTGKNKGPLGVLSIRNARTMAEELVFLDAGIAIELSARLQELLEGSS